ncbi:hypothetical protein [Williamsia sterculiae]|uniref:Uncharacterized protein n=1 Tax=Williamsia sterculiae TaxID=1344003 RepID=A0A1N7D0Y2_9NOCA|nr:hypothetical protein [Williamsia sterculiae]SIR69384.1 hypothetical protein SAMN05445060_0489 [Williamsia sterculiae]
MTNTSARRALGRRAATLAVCVAAASGAAVVGTGAAQAAPGDTVQYSPTFTVTPGFLCGARIDATKIPGAQKGTYRVKAHVQRFGFNCGTFKVGVDWKNTTTGSHDGQIDTVLPDGSIAGAPDGVLDGFGYGPGVGKVESTITTYARYDEGAVTPLPNIPGRATFTLR